jgi:hypothetical protein
MKQIISFVLLLSLFVPTLSDAASANFQFNRNLKKGDTVDPDVKYLQQVLNSKAETRVAETGSGSNQQLSAYFGAKTQDGVMRFQNLYKSEILDPAGLSMANGAVGPLTRKKLNEVLGQLSNTQLVYIPFTSKGNVDSTSSISTSRVLDGNSSGSTAATTLFPAPASQKSISNNLPDGYIKITGLSSYKAVPGQVISIFGQGFSAESNIVIVGSINAGAFNSQDKATRITFTVPKVQKSGLYQIAVNNYFGTINSGNITLAIESDVSQVVDTSTGTTALQNNGETALVSVTPKTSKNINDVITLTGANFTSQNTIQTNLGNFNVPSNDGKTIQFLAGSLPYYQKAFSLYKGKSINVLIRVNNENGLSEQLTHTIQFPNSSNPTVNSTSQNIDSTLINSNTATSSTSYSQGLTPQGNTEDDARIAQYVASFNARNSNNETNIPQTQQTSTSTKSNTGTAVAVAAGAVAAGAAVSAAGTGAASLAISPFFGGRIAAVTPCTCTGSLLLTVCDYTQNRPMLLMYVPGVSSIKANYNLTPGAATIGGFTRVPSMCWMAGPTLCNLYSYAEGTVDFIRGIGTSGV